MGSMMEWLLENEVAALEKRLWLLGGDHLRWIPAEPIESSWQRMTRRLQIYAEAHNAEPKEQEIERVAMTFCCLCGDHDIRRVAATAAYYSTAKVEMFKMLKSFNIVVQ